MPFRAAAAFTTTSQKDATSLTPHSPSFGKIRKEVPLPSEEGTKGVIQYALYVKLQHISDLELYDKTRRKEIASSRI